MSHYTCLVIGENFEEQLEPYFELECTMDIYQRKKDPRAEFVKEFTTEELEKDFERIKKEYPDDQYENLEEFANEYHGINKLDGTELWGRWTNPNSKWDWYSIGGRWTGFFKIKDNPKYPNDICTGRPGLMTEPADDNYADSIRLCDIDFEGMRIDSAKKYEKYWNECQEKISNGDKSANFIYGIKDQTKEEYIDQSSNFSTFAVIKDGIWYEKGKMGWWGITSNEKDDWQDQFNNLIKSLPEDTLLTVVDCHI